MGQLGRYRAAEDAAESDRIRYFFDHRSVTTGYLPALGVTLAEGRHFLASDEGGSQAVVSVGSCVPLATWAANSWRHRPWW